MASQTSTELPSVAGCLSPQYGSYTAEGDHTEQASTMAGDPDKDTKPTILWGPHGTDRETHGKSASAGTGRAPEDWRVPPSARPLWIEMPARSLQSLKFEPRRLEQQDPSRGGGPGNHQRVQNVSPLSETWCFRCNKLGHVRHDCRMKIEHAQFTKETQTLPLENPWIRKVKIHERKASLWLDTGYTRVLVHPRCISWEQRLSWEIFYSMAGARKVW